MKSRCFLALSISLLFAASAIPQPLYDVSVAKATAAFEAERSIIEEARLAAKRGDSLSTEALLSSQDGLAEQIAPSVLLARRAAETCAWLRNEDETAAAIRTARRAVARLSAYKEDNAADRVERLYWEAVLRGDYLNQKEAALSLLQEAERLPSDDDRIVEFSLQLAQALSEFGI